jgi:hypothetical protein
MEFSPKVFTLGEAIRPARRACGCKTGANWSADAASKVKIGQEFCPVMTVFEFIARQFRRLFLGV